MSRNLEQNEWTKMPEDRELAARVREELDNVKAPEAAITGLNAKLDTLYAAQGRTLVNPAEAEAGGTNVAANASRNARASITQDLPKTHDNADSATATEPACTDRASLSSITEKTTFASEPACVERAAKGGGAKAEEAESGGTRRARITPFRRKIAAAACLALAIVGVTGALGYQAYATPTAFVDVDTNPSIELGVNRFDTVISANALNDDGQAVLDALAQNGISLTGRPYEEASATLLESAELGAYLQDDSFLSVSVCGNNTQQTQNLRAQSQANLANTNCEYACSEANLELREEARSHNMGVGKYKTAQEAMAADSSLTYEDCAAMSMRELRAAAGYTNASTGNGHGKNAGSESGSGNGNGNGIQAHDGTGSGRGQSNGNGGGTGQGNGQGGGNGAQIHKN